MRLLGLDGGAPMRAATGSSTQLDDALGLLTAEVESSSAGLLSRSGEMSLRSPARTSSH